MNKGAFFVTYHRTTVQPVCLYIYTQVVYCGTLVVIILVYIYIYIYISTLN